MENQSVTIEFSAEDNAPTLADCLEQLLRNLSPEPGQDT